MHVREAGANGWAGGNWLLEGSAPAALHMLLMTPRGQPPSSEPLLPEMPGDDHRHAWQTAAMARAPGRRTKPLPYATPNAKRCSHIISLHSGDEPLRGMLSTHFIDEDTDA